MLRVWCVLVVCAGVACTCAGAVAQPNYPTRPIRLLVGAAPGGAADILARLFGRHLTERFNQQVVIDSRPGANQTIAAELAARAAPDGYTLLIVPAGHAINPAMHRLRYDSIHDFSAIGMIAVVPYVLVIHPSVPALSVKELVAHARRKPSELAFGSSGIGSVSHLSGELFQIRTGVQLLHVPYKGQGPVIADLLVGQLKMAFPPIVASIAHIKAGKVIALGVTPARRSSALPEVPTLAEAGINSYDVSGWYGILGPARMPKAIVAQLNGEIRRLLEDQSVRKALTSDGAEPMPSTPEEFANVIAADIVKWASLVGAAGGGQISSEQQK